MNVGEGLAERGCATPAHMGAIAEGTDLGIVADDGAGLLRSTRLGKPERGFGPKTCRGRSAWRRGAGRSGAASMPRL